MTTKTFTTATFTSDLATVCGCAAGQTTATLERPMTQDEASAHFTAIGIRDGWLNEHGEDSEGRKIEAYAGKRSLVIQMGDIQ